MYTSIELFFLVFHQNLSSSSNLSQNFKLFIRVKNKWRFSHKVFYFLERKRTVCMFIFIIYYVHFEGNMTQLSTVKISLENKKLLTLDLYLHTYFWHQLWHNMMIVKLFRGKILFIHPFSWNKNIECWTKCIYAHKLNERAFKRNYCFFNSEWFWWYVLQPLIISQLGAFKPE